MHIKPFKISADWLDYAHGPGAEDGQPVACRITGLAYNTAARRPLVSITDPLLVAEVVDVAELYVGDGDQKARRAEEIVARGVAWLKAAGIADWRAMHKSGMSEAENAEKGGADIAAREQETPRPLGGEVWDDNPDGIVPGQERGPSMNSDTGFWEGGEADEDDVLADGAVETPAARHREKS